MPPQLPFGLRDGRLLRVEEVARGLSCGCVCPACREPLVAKKGARHAPHFAHHRGGSCAHALETALHLRAKEILEQARRIAVPQVCLHRQQQPLFPAQLIRFDNVRVEQHFGGIVPDLLLEAGSRRLLLEIAATHPAPEKKLKRLQQLGLPALEIDVLHIANVPSGFDSDLIHGLAHKRWLFHPKKQGVEYRLRREAAARPVRHRYFKGRHSFIVPGCPLYKRRWQSGFRKGQGYASLWQDCLYCSRCLEIIYKLETVGYRATPQEPRQVLCWGHLPLPQAPEWVSTV